MVPSPPSASGNSMTSSCGRTSRHPAAIATAALAALMLPLNESGAATTRTASPGTGEVQCRPDRLLHLELLRPGVDCHDVLLAAEDVEHRVGLVVILAEPDSERFLGVVLALDELAAADVTSAFFARAGVDQVVVHAAAVAVAGGP